MPEGVVCVGLGLGLGLGLGFEKFKNIKHQPLLSTKTIGRMKKPLVASDAPVNSEV